jgi:NDP-sugar pyrophosphorylase family protein
MKLIILAAGYATRLYPLTLTQPKPLLEVAGRPMIEHVLDHLADVPELTGVVVISNEKFHGHFENGQRVSNKTPKFPYPRRQRQIHKRGQPIGCHWGFGICLERSIH